MSAIASIQRSLWIFVACAGWAQAATGHIPIDLSVVASQPWSIFTGGSTIPAGPQTYNGIPFNIPSGKNNAWIGFGSTSHQVTTVTIRPNVLGATTVYTLMDSVWGQMGPVSYVSITFNGSNGATFTKNLVGGVDIRDFNGPSGYTDSITPPTMNAWTGPVYDGMHFHRLDEQTYGLPAAFAGQTLTSIVVTDTGASGFQRAILAALTVDGVSSPSGLTITGGNEQTGAGGTALPANLAVTVNGSGGLKIPGVKVDFAVTSGSATLSAPSAVSDTNGSASVGVTLGPAAGSVVVTASIDGSSLPGVQFSLTALNPSCPIGPPTITSVKSATDFGGLATFAPGSWLEIKGANLTVDSVGRQWASSDFQGLDAPVSLDGSSVSIDGHAAFVSYISAGQINAQAPSDSAPGPVGITVTTCAGTSSAYMAQETALAPGMLSPASFNVKGTQYLAATFTDGATYVGNVGLIAGAAFRPAKPGDTIIAYGIGFGSVTPATAPGIVVSQANSLANLSISFGATSATTSYAGLAPNFVGLYEFYIVVPNLPDGDYPITFNVGGTAVSQTLYLTVHQ